MKIQEDPLCSARGEQEETSLHFLGECYANMQIRYSIFGAHLMQPSELHKAEPSTLLLLLLLLLNEYYLHAVKQKVARACYKHETKTLVDKWISREK